MAWNSCYVCLPIIDDRNSYYDIFISTIVTTQFGRLIRAVRDEESAAKFLGKDTVKIKMIIMMLGSALASISGVLYAILM